MHKREYEIEVAELTKGYDRMYTQWLAWNQAISFIKRVAQNALSGEATAEGMLKQIVQECERVENRPFPSQPSLTQDTPVVGGTNCHTCSDIKTCKPEKYDYKGCMNHRVAPAQPVEPAVVKECWNCSNMHKCWVTDQMGWDAVTLRPLGNAVLNQQGRDCVDCGYRFWQPTPPKVTGGGKEVGG